MNGKRKCAKVFLRNAIIIFMTFAMILTAPGLGICLSAIDISKRGNVTPVTDIAGKFEEISGIDEIDLKDAVYYSKPQNLSEVGKFKEALKKGKVTLATGKRAEEISAALSHMLPDFYKKAADEVKTSTDNNSGNIRVADMTKYLKNEYIPMTFGVAESERIDVMTGNLSLSFPLAAIAGAGGADLSLSISYNSSDSGITDKSWGGTFYTSYYVRYGELLMTTNDSGGHVSYYGENSIKYFATEHDKLAWMSPYVYPVGITVEYEGREAIYYETAILEEGTFESPLPASKPKTYLADSNGLAPGWRFDIPVLEKLDNPSASASTSSNSVSESNSDPDTGTGESTPPDVFYLLHFGGSSYRIKNLGFENRKTTDLSIEAVDITVCERTAEFLLTAKDGAKYYFDADGNIICSEDRFGRKIKYTFTVIGGKPYLSSITDDFGRSITVTYTGGAIASVSAPGNATVSFATAGSDFSSRTINSISYGGGETTSFTYLENSIGKSALYGRFDVETAEEEVIASVETEYRLISQVTYPNGDKTDYVYDTIYAEWGTDGLEELFAISSRKDTVSDAVKNLYTYTNCSGYYTMQALSGISAEERDMYWSGFTSYTNDIISGNRIVHYTFNEDNLCINESTTHKLTDGKELMLSETDTTYNSYKLKSGVVYRNYGSGGSASCVSSEAFSYDAKGNITSHRDATGNIISYTYDPLYSLVINETSRQNSTTVVKKEYALTDDKKSVATEKLLENDTLISHFDYTYNARGNVVTRTEHLGIVNVITNYTYGAEIPYLANTAVKDTQFFESYTYDAAGRKLTVTNALNKTTASAYDTRGRLLSVTYPNGSTEIHSYNIASNTNTVTSRSGLVLIYAYDGYGNLLSVKNGDETLEAHTYDEYGRLASDIKYNGGKTVYAYDVLDRLVSKIEYDSSNAVVMRTNISYSISSDKLFKTQTTVVGDSNAPSVTVAEYTDGRGFVVRKSRMNGNDEYADSYTYDNFGNVTAVTLHSGETTSYTYDCMGNVTSTTDALGNITTSTYDSRGNLLTATDARGNTAAYTYDKFGRKTEEVTPLEGGTSGETTYTYDILGRLTEEKRRVGAVGSETYSRTVNAYDDMGNLISAKAYEGEAEALVSTYTYDAAGNMLTMTAGGKTTSYTYDLFGRKTKITDARGAEETYTYRLDGALIEKNDRNGTKFTYTYDSMLRPIEDKAEKDDKTQVISYTYTATGAVRSKANETATLLYTYDSLGRVATETEISGNTSAKNEYFYNSRDLRTDHKLYRNDLLVSWMGYEYDALGRVISACTKKEISVPTYPDYSGKWHVVPSSGSEYDMNFTLSDTAPEIHSVEITDTRTNTKKYFYVPQEWELDEADGAYHSGTVTHDGTNFTGTYGIYQEFENESHVYNYTQITTYPASGLTANEYSERIYIFNDNNEIKYTVYVKRLSDGGIDNELTNIVYIRAGSHDLGENSFFAPTYHTEIVSHEPFVRYTYDAVGNRTSEIKDDGSIVTYTYNAANLLKTMITTVGNEIQQSDTYTYYLDGNVKSIKDKNNAETIYTYDSLGRIKSEEITLDGTRQCMISYTYDSAGNRATKESNGTTTTYTYDENNRLTTESTSVQAKTYTYDANGNQLDAMVDANYAGSYKYDLWNMQVEYSLDGVGKVYYTYRPDGLRRSVQGRVHIWDSGNIIADIGTETVYYIRVLTLIYAKKGETKTYYRFNGHGDVIALANSSGAIIKRYKYDSFGVEENPGIFDTNVFRYCGEYYDVETKTIYLRARYYDAETGRFTQQDGWSYAVPGFLLSLNLYTYCWNNPVNNIDPSGHWSWSKALGITLIAVSTALAVASIVMTAGAAAAAVGAAAGTIAANFGAGAATVATVTSFASGATTVAAAAATGAQIAFGLSDITEIATDGYNPVRDDLLGGNQEAYDKTKLVVDLVTEGITYAGSCYDTDTTSSDDETTSDADDISSKATSGHSVADKPIQEHHVASNKNKKYTPQFEEITDKYGLDLDDDWNKVNMNHSGRHPNKYHDFVLESMKDINERANGNVKKFLKDYSKLANKIRKNPNILTKQHWLN